MDTYVYVYAFTWVCLCIFIIMQLVSVGVRVCECVYACVMRPSTTWVQDVIDYRQPRHNILLHNVVLCYHLLPYFPCLFCLLFLRCSPGRPSLPVLSCFPSCLCLCLFLDIDPFMCGASICLFIVWYDFYLFMFESSLGVWQFFVVVCICSVYVFCLLSLRCLSVRVFVSSLCFCSFLKWKLSLYSDGLRFGCFRSFTVIIPWSRIVYHYLRDLFALCFRKVLLMIFFIISISKLSTFLFFVSPPKST